jgi:hypothetical protein
MATKAGRAKFEDFKKGAKVYLVNGYSMSEEIIKIFVTVPYAFDDGRGTNKPFGELYEWFEGKKVVGHNHTNELESHHFADFGIDTPQQKAELLAMPAYPEAMNFIFVTEWHARQFIQRLKRLYPDRIPGKHPDGSFEAQTQKEREDAKLEDSAHDETFALPA